MGKAIGWAATSATSPLGPYTFERRDLKANDVAIDIDYCGVCHTDVHRVRNEWPGTEYPVVPGHEIIGRVTSIGKNVDQFSVGELVGVGCLVDSCQSCDECYAGLEQYCANECTWTYQSHDADGELTQGGYSDHIIVRQEFVLHIPDSLDPAAAAPILCAGVTAYSPLRHYGVRPGTAVGVAGFGGLGHMAVKLAKAMGAHVTVVGRTNAKFSEARRAGADTVISLDDPTALANADRSLDVIISTIPATHDVSPYLKLLKLDGTYVIVGALEEMKQPFDSRQLIGRRVSLSGSLIGGIAETQEVLDYCATHNVESTVEVIGIQDVNDAYRALAAGEVGHRYVIDMASLVDR